MSSERYIKFGPYLEYVSAQKEIKYSVRLCPNTSCKNSKEKNGPIKSNFCPNCSCVPIDKPFTKMTYQNVCDILEDENLFFVLEDYLLPNSDKDRPINFDLNDDLCDSIPIPSPDLIIADQNWFLQYYGEAITKLKAAGFQIEVKYGFVIYYN